MRDLIVLYVMMTLYGINYYFGNHEVNLIAFATFITGYTVGFINAKFFS